MKKYTGYLAATSAMALTATLALANQATAQEDDKFVLEEIIVSATKRQTTLQDTPVSVSVTSQRTIQEARIFDLKDLQSVIPSLRVNQLQTSTNTNFIIRGFGNGANNAGIESSVGMFIDGVYRSRAVARMGDLPKLERVEVLRGPQSTLFGKNASAGVINIISAKPTFDNEGYVEAGYGNFNDVSARGYFSGGLSETVAVSIGGSFNKRDGYSEALLEGLEKVNDRNRWNIRGQLLFTPSDTTSIRIIADYTAIDEICCTVTNYQNEGASNIIQALGGQMADPNDPHKLLTHYNKDPKNTVDDFGFSLHVDHDFGSVTLSSITAYRGNDSLNDFDADFTTLDIMSTSSDVNIKTFTQEFRLASTGDNTLDWMAGAFLIRDKVKTDDGLTWGTGTRAYMDALAGSPALLSVLEMFNGFAPGTFFGTGVDAHEKFKQDNTAISLYGTVDYHVTDRLTLTGGLNYTKDKKTLTGAQTGIDPWMQLDLATAGGTDLLTNGQIAAAYGDPTSAVFQGFMGAFGIPLTAGTHNLIASGGLGPAAQQGYLLGFFPSIKQGLISSLQGLQFIPGMLDFPNGIESGKTNDSDLTWNIRVNFEVNDNVTVYGGASTGFKSSSWNLSRASKPFFKDGAALAAEGLLPNNYIVGQTLATSKNFGTRFASPEESIVYEIGLKARFNRGAINIAIFDQTIKGFQSNTFLGDGFSLTNAGEQSTKGAEVDVTWVPVDRLTLTFAATYLDAIYDSFLTGPGPNGSVEDLSGERPAGIPEWATSVGAAYNFEIGEAAAYIRGDWQYESNIRTNEAIFAVAGTVQPYRKISTFNASAGISWESGLSAQVWARNLFNDEYVNTVFPGVLQPGVINGYRNPPRTFGLSVRQTF
ncbi:MAG: TonB-dependent receptor [Alphaproteobacteria bacterium]|nr:MAG: TonB-dependent receptor [Alphaproteobacteria bacterium]